MELLPPDINESSYKFIPLNNNQILYGLGAIKGSGDSSIDLILASEKIMALIDHFLISL